MRRILPALLCAAGLSVATPGALAELLAVNNSLFSDGTAGFDPVAGPGFDTNPNNQIVRTNDTFTYDVALSFNDVISGIVVTAKLPQVGGKTVATWQVLPAYCMSAGSSISADGLTATCAVKPLGENGKSSTTDLFLTALVRSTTANGIQIPAPAITITTPTGDAPQSPSTPATVTVSAAPFYDIVIQSSTQGSPKAYGFSTASGPTDQDGFYSRPMLGLVAKNPNGFGNKGVEQLDPTKPVTVTVDLSGMPNGTIIDDFYHPGATSQATGSFTDGCGSPGIWLGPYSGAPSNESGGIINTYNLMGDIGPTATTADNLVPNGGDCAVTNKASSTTATLPTHTAVTVNISGIDTTLTRRPGTLGGGAATPKEDWWVSNKALVLWTPADSYTTTRDTRNTIKLGSFSGTSISGQALQNVLTTNDSFYYDLRLYNGAGFLKVYTPETRNTTAPWATTADPAVPSDTHVNFMAAGQTVSAQLRYSNTGTLRQTDVHTCDVIDRTAFDLNLGAATNPFGAVIAAGSGTIQYGARAAGKSRYFSATDSANISDLRNFNLPGTTEYSTATCTDPTIQWFSTPQAAEAAGGLVYVRADFPIVPANTAAYVRIDGLLLRTTYAETITTTYPTATMRRKGDPIAADTLLRNMGRAWVTGDNPDPALNGPRNDHLQVVPMKTTSRVSKDIVAVDGKATLNPPNVSIGSTLTYRLQPRYSTTFPPQPGTFTVTDVLPPNSTYVAGSGTQGGAASEPQVFINDPAPGYTRLVWTYNNVLPFISNDSAAANLPPITFQTKLSELMPNNTTFVNAVAVSGANDYADNCTYNTATTNFGTCVKSATNSVVVQTTAGYRLQKSTPTSIIEPGQTFSFQIGYASFGKPLTGADIPDMIDILPYVGDDASRTNFQGRKPASAFASGAYQLQSVTVPSNDPGMVVTYTVAPPNTIDSDPRDPSNAPGGSTKWCTQAQFGTVGCPTTLAQVTAVRLHPSLTTFPADTVFNATITLASTSAATAGDLYNNSVGSHSLAGSLLYLEVQSNSPVRMVSSGLSGQVFVDADQNGKLDAPADTPIANVCITATGSTSLGTKTYSTRTRADGTYTFNAGAAGVFDTADCTGTPSSSFSGMVSGTYTLKQTQPAGYTDGADYTGTLGGTVGNDTLSNIKLGVNQKGTGYNFTEKPMAFNLGKKANITYLQVIPDPEDSTKLSYAPGRDLTYTLTLSNPGNATLNNIQVTDPLPAGVSFVSATLDGAALTPSSTSPLTLTLPTLAANSSKDVLVNVTINPVTPNTNQTPILNTATATATGVSTVTSPQARTDLVYTKLLKQARNVTQGTTWSNLNTGYPADVLNYCIDFSNFGSTTLTNYQIIDPLPKQTEYVPGSATLTKGSMTSPGGSFPTGSVGYASSTDSVVASGLTLNPGDTGSL